MKIWKFLEIFKILEPDFERRQKRLEVLNLEKNKFSHFPNKLFDKNVNLEILKLNGNPLYCDCLIKYLGIGPKYSCVSYSNVSFCILLFLVIFDQKKLIFSNEKPH